MGNDIFQKLAIKYPFITLCVYANEEYVGVVQNKDDAVTTIYDFGAVVTQDAKLEYLELAATWWWESNRQLPVNLFIGPKFKRFSYSLRTYNVKDFELLHGEIVSLQNIITKRIKRRQIQLVQKL